MALQRSSSSHDRRGSESAGTSAMEETTGSIGGSQRATAELALSDEERGRLYEGVMRIADASVANVPAPAVADALPSGVPLQDPAGMAQEVPQVRGHKFVKFDDRIVVVDPKSRVVVAMIPRYKLLLATAKMGALPLLRRRCWRRGRGRGMRIGELQ